jgi:hypothetical protein
MSQNISDALNYTNNNIDGSARFSAMGGAFGALGGEISSISLNPAGSAIFNNSYLSLSFASDKKTNDVSLLNAYNTQDKSNLTMNQIGGVFVFNNIGAAKKWKKIVVGLSYDQTNNNFNEFFVRDFTNSNSIDSFFLANAQGLRLDQISAFENESITDAYVDIGNTFGYPHQQAFLGYESFIIEPDSFEDDNTSYTSNVTPGTFNQTYYSISRGYNGKFTANIGAQYSEKLYLGINLNGHFVDYDNYNILEESNTNGQSGNLYTVTDVNFENRLSAFGGGFSFQLGTIAKLNDWLRLGVTYDSPVWYSIKEETRQYLATRFVDQSDEETTVVLDPNAINVFDEYTIQTPSKITGSLAIIINKLGLISFDYSRKDYSKMEFRTSDGFEDSFSDLNWAIYNNLTVANSYKIGAEIRSNSMSYRAGYRIDGSPYRNTDYYSDRKGFSLGVGYKFKSNSIDLSFEKYNKQYNHQLYDAGLTNQAAVDNNNTIIKLSITSIM